jgi:molybdopterin/thiamine biosynthesis adenylyltransferase
MDFANSGVPSPNCTPADTKYDRQVRIWGAHGQSKLETAQICMLGAGPVATEAMKNLVLGGIASFTIVDHRTVQERDLGNNFFFDHEALGQGRAEAATRLLCELNENVNGSFSDEVLQDLLKASRDYFKGFSLVIATEACFLSIWPFTVNLVLWLWIIHWLWIPNFWHTSGKSVNAGDSDRSSANCRSM